MRSPSRKVFAAAHNNAVRQGQWSRAYRVLAMIREEPPRFGEDHRIAPRSPSILAYVMRKPDVFQ